MSNICCENCGFTEDIHPYFLYDDDLNPIKTVYLCDKCSWLSPESLEHLLECDSDE